MWLVTDCMFVLWVLIQFGSPLLTHVYSYVPIGFGEHWVTFIYDITDVKEGLRNLQMGHIAFVVKSTIFQLHNLVWTQTPTTKPGKKLSQLIIINVKIQKSLLIEIFDFEMRTYKTSKCDSPSSISLITLRRRFLPKSLKENNQCFHFIWTKFVAQTLPVYYVVSTFF